MWPDRTSLRIDDIFMEVGSSQEVSELGTVVGMVLPCDFQFCIHGNLEIYFREKKKEVVGL